MFGLLLGLLAFLYSGILALRDAGYRLGILPTRRLPFRVISIGNITLGGTGKTPMVINAASLLRSMGKRPVILSRGYGRQNESLVTVVSGGSAERLSAKEAGDEPAMIAARLPEIPVVVGSDRYRAGLLAAEYFQPDVAVLDDGYQHRRLARDLNIVLIDAADPYGTRKLFPAGILREPLSALRRADAVVVTRVDLSASLDGLRRDIRQYTTAPVLTARYVAADLVDIASGQTRSLSSLRGARIFAFAGIARPEAFFSLLRSLGAEVTAVREYPDHYRFTRSDLAEIVQSTVDSDGVMIVTTEKDSVRMTDMAPEGIWALRVNMEILEGEAWETLLAA